MVLTEVLTVVQILAPILIPISGVTSPPAVISFKTVKSRSRVSGEDGAGWRSLSPEAMTRSIQPVDAAESGDRRHALTGLVGFFFAWAQIT